MKLYDKYYIVLTKDELNTLFWLVNEILDYSSMTNDEIQKDLESIDNVLRKELGYENSNLHK